MKAILKDASKAVTRNLGRARKENAIGGFRSLQIVLVNPRYTDGEGIHHPSIPVEARIYWPVKGATVTCCVWYHGEIENEGGSKVEISGNGAGSAGGYGYCKQSSALESAFRSAGFAFDEGVAGVGESAMDKAVCAVADLLGYAGKYMLVRSHP